MGETNPASHSKGKLENSAVLLVGGTGGVGLAVAHELIRSSASVILTSSRKTKLDAVLEELRECYPDAATNNKINGRVCDLSVPHIEQNVIELFKSIGRLDHIIYLAGDRLPTMPLGDFTLEAFAKQSQVRAAGPLLVVKHGIKCLGTSSSASITITSGSIAGKPIAGGWSLLAFVGAGLTGLTRQLAFDLAPVRVNCVAPGVIETDMWDSMGDENKRAFFEAVKGQNCTGRVGQAEDVAEAYLYLLKDRNATGVVVDSNGGVFLK